MPPAARLGDPTAHGGVIMLGERTVLIGGMPAARMGDPHVCPMTDGPKPHIGGVITSASQTVLIGNAFAARQGDGCGCATTGVSSQGVPPVCGPAAPPRKKLLGTEPTAMLRAQIEDMDRDGTYDTASVVTGPRVRGQGQTHVGPITLGGYGYMNLLVFEGHAYASTGDRGFGGGIQAEYEHAHFGSGGRIGTVGDEGQNPFLEVGAELGMLKAGVQNDLLLGDDGRRTGLAFRTNTEADIFSSGLVGRITIPLGNDQNLQVKGSSEAAFGKGLGMGLHGFWDKQEERWHLGIFQDLKALFLTEWDIDVSWGKKYGPPQVAPGIPNTLVQGEPSVLIG